MQLMQMFRMMKIQVHPKFLLSEILIPDRTNRNLFPQENLTNKKMSEEKVLTKEIMEQFLNEEDSVDLSVYSEFEDSAIEALSNYDGQLSLDALVKEVKEWEYLGSFNHGVRENGEALACLLSKHKGDLEFDMLLELSEEEAKALANHRGNLSFGSLKSINKTTETILSEKRSQEKLKYPKYLDR